MPLVSKDQYKAFLEWQEDDEGKFAKEVKRLKKQLKVDAERYGENYANQYHRHSRQVEEYEEKIERLAEQVDALEKFKDEAGDLTQREHRVEAREMDMDRRDLNREKARTLQDATADELEKRQRKFEEELEKAEEKGYERGVSVGKHEGYVRGQKDCSDGVRELHAHLASVAKVAALSNRQTPEDNAKFNEAMGKVLSNALEDF